MNLFELYAKISVDDTDFKKSMGNAQKVSKNVANAMKDLQSPLDKAKSGFNAIAHPVETAKANIEKLKNATEAIRNPIETFKQKVSDASTALETKRNKLSALSAGYDSAKKKVDDLTKEFNKSAKESGTSSEKTQELAKKLNEAEREAAEAKKELDDYSSSVSNAGKNSESASNGIGKFGSILGKGLKTAAKVGAAAVGAASTAVVALGKIGLEYNSQMEQYTTNFTTMLGSDEAAVQKVDELKKFAASTPLSMDDLAKGTQTLLAFGVESENSTGILRQLGDIALGDADKMQRLSTAFGKATASGKVTGDTVQQMIDAGWNPLIQISKAAGETMEETQKRMSDGTISVEELQEAMEAVTSGTGQFAGGMESASHTTQGLISTLQDNAKALVGEVFMPISDGLLGSVLPGAIEAVSSLTTAFRENGISGMIEAAGGILGSAIGEFTNALPQFVDTAVEIVKSLVNGIKDNLPQITEGAVTTVETLAYGILEMLPEIIKLGLDVIVSLANGIAESLPELIPTIVDVVLQIVETLIDNVDMLVDSAIAIITALADGLINSLPTLLEKAPEIVGKLVDSVIENAPKLLDAAFEIIEKLASGLVDNFPEIVAKGREIIEKIISGISEVFSDLTQKGKDIIDEVKSGIKEKIDDAKQWGKDLIKNFIDGITAKWEALKEKVSGVAQTVKNFLGFSEPKEGPLSNFHTYAPDMMNLFAKGIRDNENVITDQIEKSFDFGERTIKFGAEYGNGFGIASATGATYGGTSIGNVTINIDGAKYSDENSLAEAIAEALQNMTDRREAVYA